MRIHAVKFAPIPVEELRSLGDDWKHVPPAGAFLEYASKFNCPVDQIYCTFAILLPLTSARQRWESMARGHSQSIKAMLMEPEKWHEQEGYDEKAFKELIQTMMASGRPPLRFMVATWFRSTKVSNGILIFGVQDAGRDVFEIEAVRQLSGNAAEQSGGPVCRQ